MKIHYLGTGAAEGIPAIFCNCSYCKSVRLRGGRAVRSRAQVIIDGDLSIDFSPDCFLHGTMPGVDLSAIATLIVTHSHCDHFYAHDFVLRGYKYAREMTAPALHILSNDEVLAVYAESVRREMGDPVREHIALTGLSAFVPASSGDWTIHPLMARHTSKDPFVYLIEGRGKRILHLTDTGLLPEEDYDYLRALGGAPLDLVTFDCTFLYDETPHSARHMGIAENVAVEARLKDLSLIGAHTKRVITHFSHNSAPTEEKLERAAREHGFLAAYDGMILEI